MSDVERFEAFVRAYQDMVFATAVRLLGNPAEAEDVAQAIYLCAAMPQRTLVEQIVMMPTMPRDQSADLAAARASGSPRNA